MDPVSLASSETGLLERSQWEGASGFSISTHVFTPKMFMLTTVTRMLIDVLCIDFYPSLPIFFKGELVTLYKTMRDDCREHKPQINLSKTKGVRED